MANAAARAMDLARKDRASSTLDQVAFFGAFLIGAASIVGLKTIGMSQLVVTSVPVGLMILYLLYVLWTRHFALGDDRIGDNLYYLGFLFTLVSIAYSLYEFTTSDDAASRIIVNFGIALATTIVGVALRVTLMQVRGDPAEVERIARMELSEAALRLRSEMDIAVQALAAARTANEQAIVEATSTAVRESVGAMTKSAESFSGLIVKTSEALQSHFEALNANATALNKGSTRIVSAAEKMWQKMESIAPPSDLLEKKLDGVVAQLDAAAGALKGVSTGMAGASGDISTATTALRSHTSAFATSAGELKRVTDEVTAQSPSLQELSTRWIELSRLIGEQQNALQAISTLDADVQLIRRHREEIRGQVEQATQLLVTLETALVSLARGLVERVNAPQ